MNVDVMRRAEIEVEAVVSDSGDLVVPAADLGQFSLVPGQRVPVTVAAPRRRKNMRGVLKGKVREVSLEDLEESSRDA